jgi:aspartyl-tRNA(Asn)/glutamyl-tRNA(Gln) amidotransferase subunit B
MFTQQTSNAFAAVSRKSYICQSCLRRARNSSLTATARTARRSTQNFSTDSNPSPKDDAPFRKILKDAAKQKKKKLDGSGSGVSKRNDARLEKWELTVGIEIHAELNTARKLFSSAAASANATPNTHVALFDTAFPGSQPYFQKETLIPALRAALALDCKIQHKSSFDRKHYFYQDQPAGYQITQYYGRYFSAERSFRD